MVAAQHEDEVTRDIIDAMQTWVKATARRLTTPMVLAVTLPWRAVGDHAFGRKIGLEEYKAIVDGELPDLVAIPLAALADAKCEPTNGS